MDERTQRILEQSVKHFIKTGLPITSGRLYKNYDFGIKPAMIRRELSYLDDLGFLSQFHTSGGRYPTKKAYQYLVNSILEDDVESKINKRKTTGIIDEFLSGERKDFTRQLSDYLKSLSVVYEPSRNRLYNSGLKELFQNLNFESKKEVSSIVEDFEELERRLSNKKGWWEKKQEWPQVFIGESPVTESKNLAVVAQRYSLNNKEKVLILAIGPRRMDYKKPIGLFKYIEKNI